ncbi:hypothetical protein R50073_32040 [Maricurvus nonylphenolicus]|uniref:alpha/beta hydrolase n=1 Tax=Maricurvus nonylphenolicus TaxID=1008307 RepID=UPI0036F3A963
MHLVWNNLRAVYQLNDQSRLKHVIRTFKPACRILLACIFLFSSDVFSVEEKNLILDARSIPIPAGASEELQKSLRNTERNPFRGHKVPSNEHEWKAAVELAKQLRTPVISASREKFPGKIEHDDIAGVSVYRITPDKVSPENENRLFIYLHGGAYVLGGGETGIGEAMLIATSVSVPVLAIDYRMPPAHPYPAAVNDVVSVYKILLKSRSPQSLAIGGTSAGGGLALAAVHQFKALGLEVPAMIYAGTPWADLTKTGDTLYTNKGLDRVLSGYDGFLAEAAKLYAAGNDLKDPLISPIYGDFHEFPPTILFSGTRDLFLSDVVRTHRKLRASGAIADLHVFEGISHAGYIAPMTSPESIDAFGELRKFFSRHVK